MNNNLRSSFKDDKITRPTKVDVSIKNAMYNSQNAYYPNWTKYP